MPIYGDIGLEEPTKEKNIVNAEGSEIITLWRGTTKDIKNSIVKNGSAGGNPKDLAASAPSKDHVTAYVGGFSGDSQINQLKDDVSEYTSNPQIAMNFSRGSLVVIKIRRKFLTKGSVSEDGWLVKRSAPVVSIKSIFKRNVKKGRSLPDAS